jgi:polygalacturonase
MSLTKVTYSMIQGTPANVLDFGADPTGSADSTTAIQAALDAAVTAVSLSILTSGSRIMLSGSYET